MATSGKERKVNWACRVGQHLHCRIQSRWPADDQQTTEGLPAARVLLGSRTIAAWEEVEKKDTDALIPELPGCALKLTQRRQSTVFQCKTKKLNKGADSDRFRGGGSGERFM